MDTSRRSGISSYYKSSVPSAYVCKRYRSDVHALKYGNMKDQQIIQLAFARPLCFLMAWVLPVAAVPCESGSPYFRLVQDALATVESKTLPGIAIAECRSPFKVRCVFNVTAPWGIQDMRLSGVNYDDVGGFLLVSVTIDCAHCLRIEIILVNPRNLRDGVAGGGLIVIQCRRNEIGQNLGLGKGQISRKVRDRLSHVTLLAAMYRHHTL